jgi:ABC-type antimicrobial peptide transport system permease subunit
MLIARAQPGSGLTPADLTRVIRGIDPNLPIRTSATGEQLTALPLLPYRAGVIALGLLGFIASGLLLSGLHAMLAYAAVKRRKEIGIRIALGADRNSVIRTVVTRLLVILSIGAAAGTVIVAGTGPLISSVVLGVSPREPLLLAGIVALLALITFVACTGPIRKSLALNPLIALRDE